MIAPVPGQHANAIDGELAENPCGGFNQESCGKPSVHKIVGESDSFGSEYYYQCEVCREKQLAWEKENPTLSDCNWCKAQNVQTRGIRDIDEGGHGPVYDVCGPCRESYYARLRDEMPDDDEDDRWIDNDPDDAHEEVIMGTVEVDIFDENNEPLMTQLCVKSATLVNGKYYLSDVSQDSHYWNTIGDAKRWVDSLDEAAEFVDPFDKVWKRSELRISCLEHCI